MYKLFSLAGIVVGLLASPLQGMESTSEQSTHLQESDSEPFDCLLYSMKKALGRDSELPNFLLYGPQELTETMVAATKKLAKEIDGDFHLYATSTVQDKGLEEAVNCLHDLFKPTQSTGIKVIVILEGTVPVFSNNDALSQQSLTFQNSLVKATGIPRKDCVVIFIKVHQLEDLSNAVRGNVDTIIRFDKHTN